MQDDSDKMLAFELGQIARGGPLAFNKATILEAIDRLAALQAKLDAVTKDADALRADIREIYEQIPNLPITPETMDAATDVLTQFCIDFNAAITDQGRAGEGR